MLDLQAIFGPDDDERPTSHHPVRIDAKENGAALEAVGDEILGATKLPIRVTATWSEAPDGNEDYWTLIGNGDLDYLLGPRLIDG
jgi:hypothetical protein